MKHIVIFFYNTVFFNDHALYTVEKSKNSHFLVILVSIQVLIVAVFPTASVSCPYIFSLANAIFCQHT